MRKLRRARISAEEIQSHQSVSGDEHLAVRQVQGRLAWRMTGHVQNMWSTGMKWEQVASRSLNLHFRAGDGHEIGFKSVAELSNEFKGVIPLE